MDKNWLRLVTNKPEKPKRAYLGEPITCPKCQSNASIEVRLGRRFKDGKYTAGQKQLRCALCWTVLVG